MWLSMSIEGPLIASAIARLPRPEVNLAAFQLTFALALLVEAPVIMLLTASTALASDRSSYRRLLGFTTILALALSAVHVGLALSPLYLKLATGVIGVPLPVAVASRTAFLMMAPWSAAIAYRRLWQGVLIRYDHTKRAGVTTVGRLTVLGAVLIFGLWSERWGGAALGGIALSAGVIAGAVAAWVLTRPVLGALTAAEASAEPLTVRGMVRFYTPLALTSLLLLGGGPAVSFALGHAPDAVQALAVWQVVLSLTFLVRSAGYAYQEVVVALQERPGARRALVAFARTLGVALAAVMAAFAFTVVGEWWMTRVTGLSEELASYALRTLPWLVLVPALSVVISLYRGRLVGMGATPSLTKAVGANLGVLILVMVIGLRVVGATEGAMVAAAAYAAATAAEAAVLVWEARGGAAASEVGLAPSGA
jgi:hypothetical protein